MRINEISITLERTINLGNYNSTKVALFISASPAEGESGEEAYQKLADATQSKFTTLVQKRKDAGT